MYMYKPTRILADFFDGQNFIYFVQRNDESERLHVPFPIPHGPTVDIQFVCNDDANSVAVRVYSLFNGVSEEQEAAVLRLINQFNKRYRFVKFCLDAENDLNVEYDLPDETTDDSLGAAAMEMFIRTGQIIGDAYIDIMCAVYGLKQEETSDAPFFSSFLRQCMEAARIGDGEDSDSAVEEDDEARADEAYFGSEDEESGVIGYPADETDALDGGAEGRLYEDREEEREEETDRNGSNESRAM